MGIGDMIYVPTKSDGWGFKNGGSAMAYKKASATYGDIMAWTAGDLTVTNQDLEIAGAGRLEFTSPTTLTTHVVDGSGWYYRAWGLGGQFFQFALRGGWLQTTPSQGSGNSELRLINKVGTVTTRYQLTFTTPASPTKPAVGIYSHVSGLNLGTVTISAT